MQTLVRTLSSLRAIAHITGRKSGKNLRITRLSEDETATLRLQRQIAQHSLR
ncbi:hypothetical protein SAMN04488118_103179 [Epibacterium ulvae]|uniref:Uncharacterized protein n=1 Tax=Epibacterium ulvae TaxID=1156985 RepID=A0A1G5Q9J5_9RHOB|nr:hypothetical protein [Epibacterium ulvae]SCZ57949.1 hypothetical protein SAMN04488118_103179 [Epibacterium ulvae]